MASPRSVGSGGSAFSFGFAITEDVRQAIVSLSQKAPGPRRSNDDGEVRDGAWVAEITERPRPLGLAGGLPGDRAQESVPTPAPSSASSTR